jgi:hypothetical protein
VITPPIASLLYVPLLGTLSVLHVEPNALVLGLTLQTAYLFGFVFIATNAVLSVAVVGVGLPAYAALRVLNVRSFLATVAICITLTICASFMIGRPLAVTASVYENVCSPREGSFADCRLTFLATHAVYGAAVGAVFWRVYAGRRWHIDRSAPWH